MKLDIIGDIHGQLGALRSLGRTLGYDIDAGWDHPEGRTLVFVGDLVDRGPSSLETAELAMDLATRRRALCLLGNHEYNLVGFRRDFAKAKRSNAPTRADLVARGDRWAPVLRFFETLPIALELDDLRVIHAAWHRDCFERVASVLGSGARHGRSDALGRVEASIALGSPLRDGMRHPDLPKEGVPPAKDTADEILIKGYEAVTDSPFQDNEGTSRALERVCFWKGTADVPGDKTMVFGHYWGVPPWKPGMPFAPPFPSGHPELRRWQGEHVEGLPPDGRVEVPEKTRFVCVDYNGVVQAGGPACVGAFRYPERQVVWATAPGEPRDSSEVDDD